MPARPCAQALQEHLGLRLFGTDDVWFLEDLQGTSCLQVKT